MSEKGDDDQFLDVLSHDVEAAFTAFETEDTPSNRRNALRTAFAGIEGVYWGTKEVIVAQLREVNRLSAAEEMAFAQQSYAPNEKGELVRRDAFIPLKASLRFLAAQMRKLDPEFSVDFGGDGWLQLERAKKHRDRVVHPKSLSDLEVSTEVLADAFNGYLWISGIYTSVLKSIVNHHKAQIEEAKQKSAWLWEPKDYPLVSNDLNAAWTRMLQDNVSLPISKFSKELEETFARIRETLPNQTIAMPNALRSNPLRLKEVQKGK